MNRSASWLWLTGSLAFFVCGILYAFVYQPPTGLYSVKISHLQENWALVANIWRVESLAAGLLAISAVSFALENKNIFWMMVGVGHIIMTLMFAFMLGAYPVAAEYYDQIPALFPMMNDAAIWIFAFSNLLFMVGLAGVYYHDRILNKWLSKTAMVIAVLGVLTILTIFFGWLTFSQFLVTGPVVSILYLINTTYGFKRLRNQQLI